MNRPLAKSQRDTAFPIQDIWSRCGAIAFSMAKHWHCPSPHGNGLLMSQGRKNPTGAGAFIALLILAGAIGGGLLGQPSIGLLAGLALGVLLALVIWLRERNR